MAAAVGPQHSQPSPPPPPQINTLFPSPKVNGSIKGGVTLLRMKRPSGANAAAPLDLTVSYVDREGQQFRWGRGRSRERGRSRAGPLRGLQSPPPGHPLALAPQPASHTTCPGTRPPTHPPALPPPSSKRTVDLPKEASQADGAGPAAFYQSTGIEKAVALARYTDLLHTWWVDGRACMYLVGRALGVNLPPTA